MAARDGGNGKSGSNGKRNGKHNGKRDGKVRGKGGENHQARRSGKRASARRPPRRVAGERAAAIAGRPTRGGESHPTVRPKGTLVIIGGHEDKTGDRLILRLVADRIGSGRLVVATIASGVPDEQWEEYERIFRRLGVKHVHHLDVATREEAKREAKFGVLADAAGVFFTGGDQLKLTSLLGDSPVYEHLKLLYERGGIVAGTSAGASVVCETMLVSGSSDHSNRIGGSLTMAPGFGLISGVIIDQHFAERGRIGRLIGAVAQNPRMLGVGIDENTAIVCDPGSCFTVVGEGAVYVVDGQDITYTNLTDEAQDRTLSAFGMRLHVLSMGDSFDMQSRVPDYRTAEEVEDEILEG